VRTLIAGASGLIGSAVAARLATQGHEVIRLVRRAPDAGEVRWDPDEGTIDVAGLEGFDGVVHVASVPWPARWTTKAKQQIRANRLATNSLLARALADCSHKPRVLVCASGMGFYPPSGAQIITEDSAGGTSWLATLQRDGEAATAPASAAGIRVVNLRIPPVLTGASIARGTNRIGNGRQWMSWVGRDELTSIVEHVLLIDALEGPTSPPLPPASWAASLALLCRHSCCISCLARWPMSSYSPAGEWSHASSWLPVTSSASRTLKPHFAMSSWPRLEVGWCRFDGTCTH
jgi:NAD dependent epimerase/dehydratase family enzyme